MSRREQTPAARCRECGTLTWVVNLVRGARPVSCPDHRPGCSKPPGRLDLQRGAPSRRSELQRPMSNNGLERTLVEATQAGDQEARNTLVESYIGACRHIAQGFALACRQGGVDLTIHDLFSEAAEYLLTRIVTKFDAARGIPFRAWVNLQLRLRLSTVVRQRAKEQGREAQVKVHLAATMETDLDYITAKTDLELLLNSALERGALTYEQFWALKLRGTGETPTTSAEIMECTPARIHYLLQRGMSALDKDT